MSTTDQNPSYSKQLSNKVDELSQREQKLTEAEQSLTETRKEFADIGQEISQAVATCQENERHLAQYKTNVSDTTTQLKELRKDKKKNAAKIDMLVKARRKLHTEARPFKDEVTKLREKFEQLKSRKYQLPDMMDDLPRKIDRLSKEIEKLKAEILELEIMDAVDDLCDEVLGCSFDELQKTLHTYRPTVEKMLGILVKETGDLLSSAYSFFLSLAEPLHEKNQRRLVMNAKSLATYFKALQDAGLSRRDALEIIRQKRRPGPKFNISGSNLADKIRKVIPMVIDTLTEDDD